MTKAEDLLDQKNISYKVTVEKESVFMTTVLPMLLICVIFMVFLRWEAVRRREAMPG